MFAIEVLQKSKYHYPAPSWHTSGAAPGICKFLFSKDKTSLWLGKESVQSVTLTMQPFGQSQSKVTAVSWNVDQSKLDVHLNSYIDPYISWTLIECVQMYKCLAPTKKWA